MRAYCLVILLCFISLGCWAADQHFSSAENEARYEALLPQIRCMICANQSVADSQSGFAQDVKTWVREAIEEGRSDTEIRSALVARFGESVLYQPMLNTSTFVLWGFPVILVLIVILYWIRGRRS